MNGIAATGERLSRTRDAVFWWRVILALAAAGFSLLVVLQPTPWSVMADAGGDELTIAQFVYIGTWWGGLGAAAVAAFLWAVCPWWARAPQPVGVGTVELPKLRWFWPAVIAAMIAAGAIAAPSLDRSLWDDEHESLVWYVLGRYVRQEVDATVKLKEHNWRRTVFGYSTPNNHIFHNILARWSNAVWRAAAKPEGLQFSEVALRIPAFLAGLACVAALALLIKDFGFPAAGVVASWFLALQPWFTDHMALARGYTLTMLFSVLALLFWRRALTTGAWKWFALLAACEFLLLWTYPAAAFLTAVLNLALLFLVWLQPAPIAGPPRTLFSRWFCCSALAGAGLLPLVGPLVPQMQHYLDSLPKYGFNLGWLANLFCFFAAGAACNNGSQVDRNYHDVQLIAAAFGSATVWVLFFLAAGFFLIGAVRFARAGRLACTATACLLLGPAAHWFYAQIKGVVLWEWYLIYALPFVCMFWGIGVWLVASAAGRTTKIRWAGPLVAVLVLGCYAVATTPVRAWHYTHTRVPYRESTQASRAGADGQRAMVFSTTGAPLAYDPQLFFIEKPIDLAILMFQADAQNRPLVANMGQMQTLEQAYAGIFTLLNNRVLFPDVERFPGFFSGGDRYVCRYAPGTADKFDFSAVISAAELSYAKSVANMEPEIYFAGRNKRHAAQGAGGYGPAPGVGAKPHGFKK